MAANDLWLSYVCFSAHKWEAQLGGFALAGMGVVAIIEDIVLVVILMRVGEAVVREQVGQYCIFIRKVEGGGCRLGQWLMLLRPRERQESIVPRQATGGRGRIVLKGGVVRVVVEVHEDSIIAPGVLCRNRRQPCREHTQLP